MYIINGILSVVVQLSSTKNNVVDSYLSILRQLASSYRSNFRGRDQLIAVTSRSILLNRQGGFSSQMESLIIVTKYTYWKNALMCRNHKKDNTNYFRILLTFIISVPRSLQVFPPCTEQSFLSKSIMDEVRLIHVFIC